MAKIRENIRLGVEPRSLAAIRQTNKRKLEEEAKAQRQREKGAMTFSDFWEAEYCPVAKQRNVLKQWLVSSYKSS